MVAINKVLALAAIAAVAVTFAACDRTITREEVVVGPQTCFECHSDQNTFLVAAEQQWQNSFHASGLNINEGSSAGCAGCHTSEGFIQRVNNEAVTVEPNPTVIHCFTCHAPHTEGNFGLRWTKVATLMNGTTFDLNAGNLCAGCHYGRRNVNTYVGTDGDARVTITSTHWGPHYSLQADMLIGSNGYEYDGYTYEITTHRDATTQTEDMGGCLECHYKATSNNVVGGHSFNMRGDARDEGGEFSELLNVAACEPCHGEIDDFNVNGVQDEVDTLMEELAVLLTDAGLLVDGHPVAGRSTSVDSAGALWNFLSAEDDRSHGVHNADYIKGLLESSIEFLGGAPAGPATAERRAPISGTAPGK